MTLCDSESYWRASITLFEWVLSTLAGAEFDWYRSFVLSARDRGCLLSFFIAAAIYMLSEGYFSKKLILFISISGFFEFTDSAGVEGLSLNLSIGLILITLFAVTGKV